MQNIVVIIENNLRFEEAFGMFKKAIKLTDAHLGIEHSSEIPLLVNYGLALLQGNALAELKCRSFIILVIKSVIM